MKKCPYCAEEIQDEAIVCRYCGRDLVEAPPKPQTVKQIPKKRSNVPILILLIVVVCILGIVFTSSGGGGGQTDTEPSQSMASVMCEDFVKDRLKAPSTAKFQSYPDQTISKQSSDTFKVISYVDAENSFGAQIRTDYICLVKYVGSNKWQLVSLDTSP